MCPGVSTRLCGAVLAGTSLERLVHVPRCLASVWAWDLIVSGV